jgi:hypothetical protein
MVSGKQNSSFESSAEDVLVPLHHANPLLSFSTRARIFAVYTRNAAHSALPILTLTVVSPPFTHSHSQADGYDPRKSKVSEDTSEKWNSSPITGDITEVPGIGPSAAKKLASEDDPNDQITNTYQLFGMYLMLRGPDTDEYKVESVFHNEKFWQWLKFKGISAHRSAIVKAIAEKTSTFFPGFYDANAYEDDDE